MIENGFYKIRHDLIDLINNRLGGKYHDNKSRPVYCCMEDKYMRGLFWAIPTSDRLHRTPNQIIKIQELCSKDMHTDIRACYYHLGMTNRPAIYRISNCLPITDKYIDAPYESQGTQLFLASKNDIVVIRQKLARILFDESKHPNKYEQHITDLRNYLLAEMTNP
jgi:hypothetical protein